MKLLILSLALIASTAAFAQDGSSSAATADVSANSSSLKQSDVTSSQTKREDIDDEITNARLRASTGAKSLFSIQSFVNYNGGSIQEPLSSKRPALSPGTSTESDVKLVGQVAIKYRMTDHDNLNAGFGFGWLTPGKTGQKGQSEDPYAGYTRTFKAGGLQNVLDFTATKYTATSAVDAKMNYNLTADYQVLADIGKTKWQVGLYSAWARDAFTQNVDGQQDYLMADPFAEYAFSDKLSFRTVFNVGNFYNTQNATSTFKHDDSLQSAGLGISLTRDIYLYPNVQWAWQDIRSDKTDVAISAYINM